MGLSEVLPKAKQIGTGVAAGGSTLILVMNMFGARLDELNKKIDKQDTQIRQYVDFKNDQTIREMTYLRDGQAEIKEMLKVIESRLYKTTSRGR